MKAEGELIAGTLIAISVLVRALEAKGVFGREDYAKALALWLGEKSETEQENALYEPLRQLLRAMRDRRALQ